MFLYHTLEQQKGAANNDDVYVRKCLPKLLAFIKTHHQHDEYIF